MAKRKSYSKKARTTSKYKPMLVDTQAVRQLQVYRYPFSVATSQPKIPDGTPTLSIGFKYQGQETKTIATPNAGVNNISPLLYVLSPLFGQPLIIHHVNANGVGTLYYPPVQNNIFPPFILTPGPAGANISLENATAFSEYRIVSQGLRLKCTANDNLNGGYWEAIRFNASEVGFQHQMSIRAADAGGVGRFFITPDVITNLLAKTNWLNNPTYQMGKTKSLSQFEFRLSPQVEDHLFIDIPRVMETSTLRYQNGIELLDDGEDERKIHQWGLDNQFDMIAIIVSAEAGSTIMSHFTANYECKIKCENSMSLFSTESTNAGSALKQKQTDFKLQERLPGHYLAGPRS